MHAARAGVGSRFGSASADGSSRSPSPCREPRRSRGAPAAYRRRHPAPRAENAVVVRGAHRVPEGTARAQLLTALERVLGERTRRRRTAKKQKSSSRGSGGDIRGLRAWRSEAAQSQSYRYLVFTTRRGGHRRDRPRTAGKSPTAGIGAAVEMYGETSSRPCAEPGTRGFMMGSAGNRATEAGLPRRATRAEESPLIRLTGPTRPSVPDTRAAP